MALRKERQGKEWLDEGIRHLELLCKQTVECADEGDIFPTEVEIESAIKFMRDFRHAHVPQIAITVNGEIAFTWETARGSFMAWVQQNGTIRFYRNKDVVDRHAFTKDVTAVPA